MKTENAMQKKIVLKVDKRAAGNWSSLMRLLGDKDLPKLVSKWKALEIGEFDKGVLLALQSGAETYIVDKLKKKYLDNNVSELLHNSLLSVIQPQINAFIAELASFEGRLDDLKHTPAGLSTNWAAMSLKNLPMTGGKINISDEYIQDTIDRHFTTYIENEAQEKLYRNILSLSKQMTKVANDLDRLSGFGISQFKDELFEYNYSDGTISPNIDSIIWAISSVKE